MSMKWWMGNSSKGKRTARPVFTASLACLLVLSSGCALLPDEAEEEVLPSITTPKLSKKPEYAVQSQTLETKVRGSGRLLSTVEEDLYFTDEGSRRIKNIAVKTGDQVQQGQLIAELDVTELENQMNQNRLQLRRDELDMIQKLRDSSELSAEELEQVKIDFELKKERFRETEQTIANSKLRAPFSGTIVSVSVEKGDTAKAYDTVATIADLSQLTVAATLSNDDLQKVSVGMEVLVDINSAGQHKGKVLRLPIPKENSGGNNGGIPGFPGGGIGGNQPQTIDDYLIVELDQFPAGLNRGTPLSVTIITNRKENVTTIPLAALRTYAGRNYVQVVDADGNKREVDVEIGQQTSTEVEIVKGLTPGQKVVGR